MPPKLASRQLTYAPPPVPSFLQKLHSQVNQSRGNINDKRSGRNNDDNVSSEFDDLLGVGSTKSAARNDTGDDRDKTNSDEEDEWDGAQVVVLKEGKHLSKEEAAGVNKDIQTGEESVETFAEPQSALNLSSSTIKKRSNASSELDGVKKLIQSSKGVKQTEDEDTAKRKKTEEKEKIKQEKNKRAKVEKSKRGKGLSFNIDD